MDTSLRPAAALHPSLEDVLRVRMAARCQRAYVHSLRNSLQAIYGGFDALKRILRGGNLASLPVDRLTELTQQAIQNHEALLEATIVSLAPREETATPVALEGVLQGAAKLLSNDAAQHGVRIKLDIDGGIVVLARPQRLKLATLALVCDGIDAAPNGTLTLTARREPQGVFVDFHDTRVVDGASTADPWSVPTEEATALPALVLPVIRDLARRESGELTLLQNDATGRCVRLQLPVPPDA